MMLPALIKSRELYITLNLTPTLALALALRFESIAYTSDPLHKADKIIITHSVSYDDRSFWPYREVQTSRHKSAGVFTVGKRNEIVT